MWLLLPLRNLLRSRRRTVLSAAVIALGTGVALVVLGFVDASRALIQETTVQQFGNLQVATPENWADEGELADRLLSSETASGARSLATEQPGVTGVTAQLAFSGLVSQRRSSQAVQAVGVEPQNPVLSYEQLVVKGRDLLPDDRGTVLLGRTLADELGMEVGGFVNLTATTIDGAFNVLPLEVVGIYTFPTAQVEARQIFLPLAAAQILLGVEAVDRLVVSLERLELTAPVAASLQGALGAAGLGLEIRTWDELSPFYTQLSGFFDILFGLLIMAVFVLVFFILLQVLTLAFSERIREVGTLRALGTKQGQVMQLFVGEAAWLGLLGGAAGVAAGGLLAIGFNAASIPWQPPGSLEPVTLAVRISWPTILVPLAVSALSTILSAVFPAFQAGRVSVVEALRVN